MLCRDWGLKFIATSNFSINVVLVEPEIPSNTGNVARTCVAVKGHLHLVGPLGFEITDKQVKRAGLDYWSYLRLTYYSDWLQFAALNPSPRMFFFSKKAKRSYWDAQFQNNDYFIFGPETRGLDEKFLDFHSPFCLQIPMYGNVRSLNLSNSVAIVAYEACRQLNQTGSRSDQ